VVFLISDFMDKGFEKPLKILSRKHDVIAIHLKDRREEALPRVGLVEVVDPETDEQVLVDFSSARMRTFYEQAAAKRHTELDSLFKNLKIDKISIGAESSYVEPLVKFFKLRERRLRLR
jgi:hypothetical protein